MKVTSLGKRIAGCVLILALIMLSSGFFPPAAALADAEGIAMSSTFAGSKYEIPSGSSVSSSEIFVTISSEYTSDIGINMTAITPVGVSINLSPNQFTLKPGLENQQKISITVIVTKDAAAGNYTIAITATPYRINPGGVQTLPETTHTASLSIIGESANVTILAVSPDDTPVTAELRLFKLIEGRNQEVAYDVSTSSLNAIVAPGTFLAQAYVGSQLLDEETFEVAADENKTIKLTAGTIYFENPGILPYYDEDNGELAFINIYYTVRNVYEPVDNVAIKLLVTLDGNTIEQKNHSTIPTLVIGRASGSIDYYPYSGNGEYGFTLQLFVDGNPYTNSPEMTIEVVDNGSPSGKDDSSNMPLIVGIVCAVVLLLDIVFYMIYRSRKAKHTQSGTKKSKQRE
jgi:hypothetical protein